MKKIFNKKSLALNYVVLILLTLFVVIFGYSFLSNLNRYSKEARDKIWPDLGDFQPTIFEPTKPEEVAIDNSIKALICSIKATIELDKKKIDSEKKFSELYNKKFLDSVCSDLKASKVSDENSDNNLDTEKHTGKLCTDNLGVCVFRENKPVERGTKFFYDKAYYDENNKDTCPKEMPYCQMICSNGYSFGSSCVPGKKECSGLTNDYASYCLASGISCQIDCSPGFLNFGSCFEDKQKNIVRCDAKKKDILEELKLIAKQNQIMQGKDCTDGKAYGSSCVKCSYDVNQNFKCYVLNFNLPQEMSNEKNFFDKWISGFGDPKYIVFYEAFPQGEEQYWQADYFSLSPLVLWGGVIASIALPADSDIIEKAILMKTGKASFSDVLKETTSGNILTFFSNQATRIKSGLFLKSIKNKEYVYKIELIQKSVDYFGGKLNPFKEYGTIDSSQFIPIFRKYIDETGKITNEKELINELNSNVEKQWLKTSSVEENIIKSEAKKYSEILMQDSIKPVFSNSLDVAKARIARNFDIPINILFKKGTLDEKALDAFLENSIKKGEDLNYIIKSGVLKNDINIQDYLKKLNLALEENLETSEKDKIIKEIIENLEKRISLGKPLIEKYGEDILTKTPFGYLVDTKVIENKFLKLGLSSFNTEKRAFTLLIINWLADLIDSQNQKFMPHGLNTIVVKTPNMFNYEFEYDLKDAKPYTIIIKTQGKNSDKFKRMYFASPCKADLEISKVNFYQKLTTFYSESNVLNYDVFDFGSGFTLVKKGTIDYKIPKIIIKQEKVKDITNFNEFISEIRKINGLEKINSDSNLRDILKIAIKILEEAKDKNSENIVDSKKLKDSLRIFVLLTKYYDDFSNEYDVYSYVDLILTNPDLFLKIDKQELKEIAFEELTDINERATNFYKYINDDKCKSIQDYKNNNCDEILNYFIESPFIDSPYYNYLLDNYDENSFGDLLGIYFLNEDFAVNFISNKYKAVLFYINNPYNTNDKTQEEKYVYDEFNSKYPYMALNRGYGNFRSGNALFPIHEKYKTKYLNNKKVKQYPNFITYFKEYYPIYKKFLEDNNFKDDSDIELFDKKSFFEEKAKYYSESSYFVAFDANDLKKWLEISKEINNRKLYSDYSMAVKAVDNIELSNSNDISLTSWGIEINAILDKKEQNNYCYQSYNPGLNNVINAASFASLFLDDVVGSLGAIACAPSTAGAVVCYKAASAATNLITSIGINELQKLRKWPERGDI